MRTAEATGQTTKIAISARAGVTKNAISSRCRQPPPTGRGATRRTSARRVATWDRVGGVEGAAAPWSVTVRSLLLVRRLLRRVGDVLRRRLVGEEQGDLVVHRAADGGAERRVEVLLDVRRLVAHREQPGQCRVLHRAGGSRVGGQT